jgi:lysozyme
MNISQVGINLIKSFEGCKLTSYKALPTETYLTIGWGHNGSDVREGQTITQAEADSLFLNDIQVYIDGVASCVKIPLNQYQVDALISLCYNIGVQAFQTSTLVQLLNSGDIQGASNEFLKWVHSGGEVIQGLVNRREAEQKLFNYPVPDPASIDGLCH